MSWLDGLRAGAHRALDKIPGRAGDTLRKVNDALGRPLADEGELADRAAFDAKMAKAAAPAAPATAKRDAAPVVVYYMDKQKRDVGKLTDILEANGVAYKLTNIQEDPAAQYAVRRDSKGIRLPVVFVAGECLGGREQLVNAAASGDLKRKVFGA